MIGFVLLSMGEKLTEVFDDLFMAVSSISDRIFNIPGRNIELGPEKINIPTLLKGNRRSSGGRQVWSGVRHRISVSIIRRIIVPKIGRECRVQGLYWRAYNPDQEFWTNDNDGKPAFNHLYPTLV